MSYTLPKDYYKTVLHSDIAYAMNILGSTACLWSQGAFQKVVCDQELTLKPLVVLLCVIAGLIIYFKGIELLKM